MFGSALNSLFLIAYLFQRVSFLQCRSIVEVGKHPALSGQRIMHCLRSCKLISQTDIVNRTTTSNVKFSKKQFCYEKCLERREIGQSVSGNNRRLLDDQQKKSSLERIKRDISDKQNSTSSWTQNECIKITSNSTDAYRYSLDGLRVTFHKLKDTGRYYANVSWTLLYNNSGNWTGYRVVYIIDPFPVYQCKDLKKSDTNYIVKNSTYGLRNQSKLYVGVTFLPYTAGQIVPLECTVPMDCPDSIIKDGETKPWTTDSSLIDSKIDNAVVAVIISGCTIVVLVISASIVFLYFRRLHRYQRTFSQSDLEFEYDAFVIFSSEDSDWVIKTLIPTLEEKHGLKCCVHYRDFTLGVPIRQNMVDSVYKCKKTVAVVSTNFFNSKYCGSELDYALHRLMERKDDSLVVIKLDSVHRSRLPKELQKRSYIDYPKSTEKETWEKQLINCLQTSSYPSQSNIL